MLVDSHCHLNCLDLANHEGGLTSVLAAAQENGVHYMLCVCIDLEHFPEVLAIAQQYPKVNASVGLHPTEQGGKEPTVEQLIELAQAPEVVAIGETGLDYYRCDGDMRWQQNRFRTHIRAARQANKPLIIHSRLAPEATISILKDESAHEVGGVMHCFTESWEMAQQAMALGFYISISGIVTFKNAKNVQEVAQKVPLERLLVETDSPYLAPEPYRGKPNEPAYVRYVAEKIAELKGIAVDQVAKITSENYFNCFTTVPRNEM